MADAKITDLIELVGTPAADDVLAIVDLDAAPATTKKITTANLIDGNASISANTTHRSSDGKDHSDVVLNNSHRTGDGSDHADVATNTTHRSSDGKDHSDVVLNNTHRSSDGKDHSDVVLNNTHRASDGKDHSDVVLNNAHRVATGNPHGADTDDISEGATNKYFNPGWAQYLKNGSQTTSAAGGVVLNINTDADSNFNGFFDKPSTTEIRTLYAGFVKITLSAMFSLGDNGRSGQFEIEKNGTLIPGAIQANNGQNSAARPGSVSIDIIASCAVNDTFRVRARPLDGTDITVPASQTVFKLEKASK